MELRVSTFRELDGETLYRLLKLRVNVFVVEQHCPYPELDDRDQEALHVWLEEDGEPLAYLRILSPGVESEYAALGRVVTARRGEGLGRRILEEGVRLARECLGAGPLYLEAQVYAKGFYEKLGFRQSSEIFSVDGIPHVAMIREER